MKTWKQIPWVWFVKLIMAFEEAFDGEIPDEEAQSITTVGEAVTYVDERMRAQ